METTPQFLQGTFDFAGTGLTAAASLHASLVYVVPSDKRAQLIYFRAGNSADALVAVTLTREGKTFRVFPIGAKMATHVPLAVVEDLMPDSKLEVLIAAPAGVTGEIVLDIGLIEI